MKKLGFLVLLMGALTLHSCTRYRVAAYTISNQTVYFTEKRVSLRWFEIDKTVETNFNDALKRIEEHKASRKPNKTYIKVK